MADIKKFVPKNNFHISNVRERFGVISALLFIFIILTAIFGYFSIKFYWENSQFKEKNKQLEEAIKNSSDSLANLQKEKDDLVAALSAEAEKNNAFANKLGEVTQNLDKLRWVNSLDPQLLQKYSKVYFLNENYTPKELSPIETKYLANKSRSLKIEMNDRALPFLQNMLQAAATDGVTIEVASAYRSFAEQASLKSSYRVTYGSGANAFSADQGYSEHQLGTALDFSTPTMNGGLTESFTKTSAYTWLTNNAYKFGFILSYPKNNAYYVFEPWHWRFVGLDLALKLHTENKNFYDLDQRDINAYLATMFNTTVSTSAPQ